MHRTKSLILIASILVCIVLAGVAMAEGSALSDLWSSGCALLFHTDNVTVDGEATFSLDGTYFKTAQLHYVQDGYRSYYGLELKTPRASGVLQESGWTIIADEEGNYAVMEVCDPGIYHPGTDNAQNSLLRRTVYLDALTDLGGVLVGQVEALLPSETVTESADGDVRTVRIVLKDDQIPALAVSALNAAAEYLCNRWFAYGYDRSVNEEEWILFDNYVTVTQALTDGTVRWALKDADVEFSTDAQGRLSAGRGVIHVTSTFWDGAVRTVEVNFDFTVTDYGTSHVDLFNPDEYGVTLPPEWAPEIDDEPDIYLDDEVWEMWTERAREALAGQGYSVSPNAEWGGWYSHGAISIRFANPDETEFYCVFSQNGPLMYMHDLSSAWPDADESADLEAANIDGSVFDAVKEQIHAFVSEQNPDLTDRVDSMIVQSVLTAADGSRYLSVDDSPNFSVTFIVQIEPDIRISYYSSL